MLYVVLFKTINENSKLLLIITCLNGSKVSLKPDDFADQLKIADLFQMKNLE